MNKYGIDEATEAKLYDEAAEYSKTDEFELDKQDMQYKLQMEGKEIPDDEKLNEMVKQQYVDIRCRELYCEKTDILGKKQILILKMEPVIWIVNVAENIKLSNGCKMSIRRE